MRVSPLALALLLTIAAPTSLFAAPPVSPATALKQSGDDLLARRQFVEALDAYERSFAIDPNPALHYNRGRALEFLARYPEAVDAFKRFAAEAPADLKAKVPNLPGHVVELEAKVATFTLVANVPGARVLFAGREVGRVPLTGPVRVNAGTATLEAVAEGYVDYRQEVTLAGGTATAINVELSARDVASYLLIKSPVASARVSIDGKFVGLVPAEATLAPGPHPVHVERDGYDSADTQIVLRKGERREVSIDLSQAKPIYARWWFWTGIGVVVAGAAAGASYYALTTERAAPSGNFSPGQLSF